MSKDSAIEWTNATFNPWWGCTKVSPACAHCYAKTLAERWGHKIWGPNTGHRFFGEKHWREPLAWNRIAEREGKRKRVFCASMADVFEDDADLDSWRTQLWALIEATPWLDWLLLTKRPENVRAMVPWGSSWPPNVWLGTTVEDDEWAAKRIPALLESPAAIHFLSCEPLLGPIDLSPWLREIDWVITGGESGAGSRKMQPVWLRNLRDQCTEAGVSFFFKQWGDWRPDPSGEIVAAQNALPGVDGEAGITLVRLGKKNAGRDLDGRTWDEMPNMDRARLRKAMAKQWKEEAPASASTTMNEKEKEKEKTMTTASLSNRTITAQPMEVREIPLSEIVVPEKRARRLRDVEPFMESIDKRGLIEPIVVRLNPSRPGLLLISGEHRLEAHSRLGRKTISARIVDVSDSEAELLEIDANLVQSVLTALERGELTTRRKELYEQIHPETKQGGAPGKGGGGKTKAKGARVASFADDTAAETGRAKRTIQEDNQIGRISHNAREAIRGTWLENQKRLLLEITKVAEQDQLAVAQIMISGKCSRAEAALLKLGLKEAPLPRRKRGGFATRVGEVIKSLRETGQRWGSLVADYGLANTSQAKSIGEDIEALRRKIEGFARSRDEHAGPARLALPPWNGAGDENDVAA